MPAFRVGALKLVVLGQGAEQVLAAGVVAAQVYLGHHERACAFTQLWSRQSDDGVGNTCRARAQAESFNEAEQITLNHLGWRLPFC